MPTTPTASTGDIQVTTSNAGEQYWATPVSLIDGGYMVFAVSTPLNNGLYRIVMQRFDNSGAKVGSEVLISTSNNTGYPVAVQLAGGNVAVAWPSQNGQMLIQLVSSTGSLVGSVVNTGDGLGNPRLVATADGGFVLAGGYNASSGRMYFYDSAGTLQHTTTTAGDHLGLTLLQNGSFFTTTDAGGTLSGQLYTAAGVASGGSFSISASHTGNAYTQLATLANGDVVVTWQTNGASGTNDVAFRIFHADGSAATGDIDVVAISGRQERPSVLALNDGGFIVTWEDLAGNDGNGEGVRAQRFDASGATVGSAFTVSATTSGDQEIVLIPPAQLSDGSVAFTWFGPGGGGNDAFTRIFAVDGNPSTPAPIVQTGGGGGETLDGGNLADILSGGGGDDIINGAGGADLLSGDDGNDIINGGTGADFMSGGTGDDTYYVDNTNDATSEAGGDGYDTVHTTASWTLGSGFEMLVLDGSGNINGFGNGSANVIFGNDGGNFLNGQAGNDILSGGGGSDLLAGGADNDILNGDAGNDALLGEAGNDKLNGGDGDDQLQGGAGADQLNGGIGVDLLQGGDGNDTLDGGAGDDDLEGGAGNDVYYVDAGDTVVEAVNEGIDVVRSSVSWVLGANVEQLELQGSANANGTGNSLANRMVGNSGDNSLSGGAGVDTLDGGGGADTIVGGTGNDLLTGGTGADTFVVLQESVYSSKVPAGKTLEIDFVYDLNKAEGDKLDLSGIDANATLTGDQAFTLVSSFTKTAGQMTLVYAVSTNQTVLSLDTDGDGKADYQMKITGDLHLDSAGWIL